MVWLCGLCCADVVFVFVSPAPYPLIGNGVRQCKELVMSQVVLTIIGILVTIILGLGGFFGKTVTDLLKGILDEIKKWGAVITRHDEKIATQGERLDDHEDRIRSLEGR